VAQRAHRRRGTFPPGARYEDGAQERDAGCQQERIDGRKREPVDVRLRDRRDHLNWDATSAAPWSPRKEGCVIAAGQTESASRQAISGTVTPSSAGRRSSAESETAGPTSRCSTAEIRRRTYIAASTIATAPVTAQPHPRWKTPARMRNSPANADESA